ncbi:hypothetical protein FQZ97_978530 [compost metagenome]
MARQVLLAKTASATRLGRVHGNKLADSEVCYTFAKCFDTPGCLMSENDWFTNTNCTNATFQPVMQIRPANAASLNGNHYFAGTGCFERSGFYPQVILRMKTNDTCFRQFCHCNLKASMCWATTSPKAGNS